MLEVYTLRKRGSAPLAPARLARRALSHPPHHALLPGPRSRLLHALRLSLDASPRSLAVSATLTLLGFPALPTVQPTLRVSFQAGSPSDFAQIPLVFPSVLSLISPLSPPRDEHQQGINCLFWTSSLTNLLLRASVIVRNPSPGISCSSRPYFEPCKTAMLD